MKSQFLPDVWYQDQLLTASGLDCKTDYNISSFYPFSAFESLTFYAYIIPYVDAVCVERTFPLPGRTADG